MEDNSKAHYIYPSKPIHEVFFNPSEYIIPECLPACQKLWNNNIFTASCSNRNELKDKNGKINKYIMMKNLSTENAEKFNKLTKSKPENYVIREILGTKYYCIVMSSDDDIQKRECELQKFLDLVSHFVMQDCLEGFISIKDYYLIYLANSLYTPRNEDITCSNEELISIVTKHLNANGKLNLLDLDRGIIYLNIFYKDAHQKYINYLRSQQSCGLSSKVAENEVK